MARAHRPEGGTLRRGAPGAGRAALGAGLALIAISAIELCAREVARASLLSAVGIQVGTWTVVGIAVAGFLLARLKPAATWALLFTVGVALQLQLGARLQSDGFYYFAYLRSLAFDRDVDFTNDYKLLGLGDKAHLFNPTPTGYAQSAWTIGPAIVWSPFFAAAHPIARVVGSRRPDITANGISFPYRQAVCIAGLFYGLLGCWFTWRLVSLYFNRKLAAGATAFVVLGSFMLWYLVKEPSMTHAPSMAGAAAFAWMWAATRGSRSVRQWALLGALAGFIGLIRWQNILFALLPACDALIGLVQTRRRGGAAKPILVGGAAFTACAVLGFLPQMLAWNAIYGSFLAVSPVGPQIRFWDPHLVDILWSSRNGLFSWSPALYAAAAGLVIFAWGRAAVGIPVLLAIIVMWYFNASIQDWWGSAGFGGRRFDGTVPLFALGAAALAERGIEWTRHHPLRMIGALGALFLLWNFTLVKSAQDGHLRVGEAVSFGEAGAHQARAFHRWFGHPFTYPASLVYAARSGVPIGAYDLLSANRLLADPLNPSGRLNIGEAYDGVWLGTGWHGAERSGTTSFRWTTQSATLLVPLDHTATLRVDIRAQAFNYPGAPPQSVSVVVNGEVQPSVALNPDWTLASFVVEESAWRTGVNRLLLRFDRQTRPVDVGIGADDRLLSAAIDYVHVEVVSGS